MAKKKTPSKLAGRTSLRPRQGGQEHITSAIRPAPRIPKQYKVVSAQWAAGDFWIGVTSASHKPNVAAIRYEYKLQRLHVLFTHGTAYVYSDVEASTAEAMFNCSSMGSFVHQVLIKRGYSSSKYSGLGGVLSRLSRFQTVTGPQSDIIAATTNPRFAAVSQKAAKAAAGPATPG